MMVYRNLLLHPSSRQLNLHAFSQLKDYRPKHLEDLSSSAVGFPRLQFTTLARDSSNMTIVHRRGDPLLMLSVSSWR